MSQNSDTAHRVDAVELTLRLPEDVSAAGSARRAVAEKLAGFPLSNDLLGDILLVTSELVTNAFEHGKAPCQLKLIQTSTTIGLRVYDCGEKQPIIKESDPLRTRSRGLQLVTALASGGWGWVEEPKGKYVWANFILQAVT